MPRAIANTTLTASYDDATFSFGDIFASGFITVANNPAFMQMGIGPRGQMRWGTEMLVAPSVIPLQGGTRDAISGVRFKYASNTTPLPQVFGVLFYPGEPSLGAGTPFTQTVTPAGAVVAASTPTLLYDYRVGSTQASIDTFVDDGGAGAGQLLPTTFRLLEVWMVPRSNRVAITDGIDITFNNDGSAIYDYEEVFAQGNPASASGAAILADTHLRWPGAHGASGGAGYPGIVRLTCPNYGDRAADFWKVGEAAVGIPDTSLSIFDTLLSWGYRSTAAISRIKIAPQIGTLWTAGTRMYIYGR